MTARLAVVIADTSQHVLARNALQHSLRALEAVARGAGMVEELERTVPPLAM